MGRTYRVVKFIVNVRLMEKSVNSPVGSVMVVKVMTQYRKLGTAWKTKRKRRPMTPGMIVGTGGVVAGRDRGVIEMEDCRMAVEHGERADCPSGLTGDRASVGRGDNGDAARLLGRDAETDAPPSSAIVTADAGTVPDDNDEWRSGPVSRQIHQ